MKITISPKKALIEKANSTVVVIVALTAFVVAFSLVGSRALLGQRSYQSKIVSKKEAALTQLKANVAATEQLVVSYQTFVEAPVNVLGGNSAGDGERDGDNARIVLDALPSKYDFPAVATSLEKLMNNSGMQINNITGNDDEIAQQGQSTSADPEPVEIPYGLTATGDYDSVQRLIDTVQRSIRPLKITELNLKGSNTSLTVQINGMTYYQPRKSLDISTEVVQ